MDRRPKILLVIGLILAAPLALALCAIMAYIGYAAINEAAAVPPATPGPPPTPTPDPLVITFEVIQQDQGDLTDARWAEYRRQLVGRKAIGWAGVVSNVKQDLGGDYYVEVEIGHYFDDVFLYVDEDSALKLEKGRRITFSGTVSGTDLRLIRDGFALEMNNVKMRYAD